MLHAENVQGHGAVRDILLLHTGSSEQWGRRNICCHSAIGSSRSEYKTDIGMSSVNLTVKNNQLMFLRSVIKLPVTVNVILSPLILFTLMMVAIRSSLTSASVVSYC
jgi:hypothetical protein